MGFTIAHAPADAVWVLVEDDPGRRDGAELGGEPPDFRACKPGTDCCRVEFDGFARLDSLGQGLQFSATASVKQLLAVLVLAALIYT